MLTLNITTLNSIKNLFDSINENVGKLFAWSTSLMVWVICIDVIMRYVFSTSFIWIVELEIYFFALSFLFAGGYAFKHDKHVRVDLFYAKWSAKGKARVNLIGGLFFLMPWCIVSIIVCWKYAMTSFKLGENSQQPGGLPALYILKFCIVIGFVLLLLQGIASIIESILVLQGKMKEEGAESLGDTGIPSIDNEKNDGTWEL